LFHSGYFDWIFLSLIEESKMHNGGMKLTKYAAAFMLATLSGGAQAEGIFSVSALYGQKYLEQVGWEPNESQSEIGAGLTFSEPEWPVVLVWNYLQSSHSAISTTTAPGEKISADTKELSFGVRKKLTEGATNVFAEGGVVSISASGMNPTKSGDQFSTVSATALGLWLGAGLDVMVGNSVSVGGLIRMSKSAITQPDVGGTHFAFYATYHIP
jgi:hypothetical protein